MPTLTLSEHLLNNKENGAAFAKRGTTNTDSANKHNTKAVLKTEKYKSPMAARRKPLASRTPNIATPTRTGMADGVTKSSARKMVQPSPALSRNILEHIEPANDSLDKLTFELDELDLGSDLSEIEQNNDEQPGSKTQPEEEEQEQEQEPGQQEVEEFTELVLEEDDSLNTSRASNASELMLDISRGSAALGLALSRLEATVTEIAGTPPVKRTPLRRQKLSQEVEEDMRELDQLRPDLAVKQQQEKQQQEQQQEEEKHVSPHRQDMRNRLKTFSSKLSAIQSKYHSEMASMDNIERQLEAEEEDFYAALAKPVKEKKKKKKNKAKKTRKQTPEILERKAADLSSKEMQMRATHMLSAMQLRSEGEKCMKRDPRMAEYALSRSMASLAKLEHLGLAEVRLERVVVSALLEEAQVLIDSHRSKSSSPEERRQVTRVRERFISDQRLERREELTATASSQSPDVSRSVLDDRPLSLQLEELSLEVVEDHVCG